MTVEGVECFLSWDPVDTNAANNSKAPVDWNPANEEEKAVKNAFETLNFSNDKVVISAGENKPNRFILHSKGYFGT